MMVDKFTKCYPSFCWRKRTPSLSNVGNIFSSRMKFKMKAGTNSSGQSVSTVKAASAFISADAMRNRVAMSVSFIKWLNQFDFGFLYTTMRILSGSISGSGLT